MVSKTPDMVMRDMDFSATLEQHQPRRIENDTDQPSNAAKEVERLEIQLKLNEQQNGDAKLYTFFLQAVPKCLLVVFLILLTTVAFIERSPREYFALLKHIMNLSSENNQSRDIHASLGGQTSSN